MQDADTNNTIPLDQPRRPIEIFYLYASEDRPFLRDLQAQLAQLRRQGLINVWHDQDIALGRVRQQEIEVHLNKAHIILFLVSPDFLGLDYENRPEIRRALERAERGEVRVIPIILRHCNWQEEEQIRECQVILPSDAHPVTQWNNRDEAFLDIQMGLRKIIEELSNEARTQPGDREVTGNLSERTRPLRGGSKQQSTKEQLLDQGIDYYNRGELERSLEVFQQAIQIDEDYALAHYNVGVIQRRLNKNEEALQAFEQATPGIAIAYVGMGNAYYDLEHYKEALQAFEQAIEKDPLNSAAYNGKGAALSHLERNEEALTAFDEAIRLDHSLVNAYIGKGKALFSLGRKQEALENFSEASKRNPSSVEFILENMEKIMASPRSAPSGLGREPKTGIVSPADEKAGDQNPNTPSDEEKKKPDAVMIPVLPGNSATGSHISVGPTTLSSTQGGRQRKKQPKRLVIAVACLIAVVVIIAASVVVYLINQPKQPVSLCDQLKQAHVMPSATPTAVGVSQAPDNAQEYIGVSDGTYIFDTGLQQDEVNDKQLAASEMQRQDYGAAVHSLGDAVKLVPTDGEAQIYYEDAKVLQSGKPYVTLVVATILSGPNRSIGADDLQGAAVAQQAYNKQHSEKSVRLLIANSGSDDTYESVTQVAQQIIQVAHNPSFHFAGVVGWPTSQGALYGHCTLQTQHIMMLSPTASTDQISGPYFFRIAPPDSTQGEIAAYYVNQILKKQRVAILYDPGNVYSQTLESAFSTAFLKTFRSSQHAVFPIQYVTGNQASLQISLQKALSTQPDLLYFSGYSADFNWVRGRLLADAQHATLPAIGGDALYNLGNYQPHNYQQFYFTSFFYPDMWNEDPTNVPPFFTEYSDMFDPSHQYPGQYGRSRADSNTVLTYDATLALLQGYDNIAASGFTPENLQATFAHNFQYQGASGLVTFNASGDNPVDKILLLIYVDKCGHAHEVAIKGDLEAERYVDKGPLYPIPPPDISCKK